MQGSQTQGKEGSTQVCEYIEENQRKREADELLGQSKKSRNWVRDEKGHLTKAKRPLKLHIYKGFRQIFQKENGERSEKMQGRRNFNEIHCIRSLPKNGRCSKEKWKRWSLQRVQLLKNRQVHEIESNIEKTISLLYKTATWFKICSNKEKRNDSIRFSRKWGGNSNFGRQFSKIIKEKIEWKKSEVNSFRKNFRRNN